MDQMLFSTISVRCNLYFLYLMQNHFKMLLDVDVSNVKAVKICLI